MALTKTQIDNVVDKIYEDMPENMYYHWGYMEMDENGVSETIQDKVSTAFWDKVKTEDENLPEVQLEGSTNEGALFFISLSGGSIDDSTIADVVEDFVQANPNATEADLDEYARKLLKACEDLFNAGEEVFDKEYAKFK